MIPWVASVFYFKRKSKLLVLFHIDLCNSKEQLLSYICQHLYTWQTTVQSTLNPCHCCDMLNRFELVDAKQSAVNNKNSC